MWEVRINGAEQGAPLVTVDHEAVVVIAVKPADDGSGDVVVRCHEAHGGRARATLTAGFEGPGVTETDLLERTVPEAAIERREGDRVGVRLRPFQLVTLRFRWAWDGSGIGVLSTGLPPGRPFLQVRAPPMMCR